MHEAESTRPEKSRLENLEPSQILTELARLAMAVKEEQADNSGIIGNEGANGQQQERMFADIRDLPQHNVEHARVVYDALASSESPDDRSTAATFIHQLAKVDPDHALPIWERLMGDDDKRVRQGAYETLTEDAVGDEELILDFRAVIPLFQEYLSREGLEEREKTAEQHMAELTTRAYLKADAERQANERR